MACLARVDLERIATGADSLVERRHLVSCSTCTRELARVRAETDLVASLRSALGKRLEFSSRTGAAPEGFELLGEIGRGGQGEIHEAIQSSSGRRVALKLLLRGRMATAAQRARFLREIRLASSLEHPGLVTVHEAGETSEGTLYLAMERVHGPHFDAWADELRSQDPANATRRILAAWLEVCDAIAFAHAADVVHRDIKPSNVLVDSQGRARVLDLGLAKHLTPGLDPVSSDSFHTRTGEFVGSLSWASPERLAGDEGAGFPSDVYSLGLLLHRVVLGREAHQGAFGGAVRAGANPVATTLALTSESTLLEACRPILRRALAVSPSERHAHAGELAREVRSLLREGMPKRRTSRKRARSVAFGSAAVGLIAALAWLTTAPRSRIQAGSPLGTRMMEIMSLPSGAEALDAFLVTTAQLQRMPSNEAQDWAVPDPESESLSHWRLAGAHVWRLFPARLRVQLEQGRQWTHLSASSAGDRLAAVDSEGKVEIFDASGDQSRPLSAHAALSSFGHFDLSPEGDWAIAYWKSTTGEQGYNLFHLAPEGNYRLMRNLGVGYPGLWAQSRSLLAVLRNEGRTVELIDPERADPLETIVLPDGFGGYSLCFLENDSRLLIVDLQGNTRLHTLGSSYSLAQGRAIPAGAGVMELDNGHWLLVAPKLEVLDPENGVPRPIHWGSNPVRALPLAGPAVRTVVTNELAGSRAARYSKEPEHWIGRDPWRDTSTHHFVAAARGGRILATLNAEWILTLFEAEPQDLPRILTAGDPDGTLHAVLSLPGGGGWVACQRNSLVFFEEGEKTTVPVVDSDEVLYQLQIAQDGRVYFSTSKGRVGSLLRANGPDVQWHAGHGKAVSALALDPDEGRLASADDDGDVLLETLGAPGSTLTYKVRENNPRVPRLAFDPLGRWIVGTVRQGGVFWWQPGSSPFLTEERTFTTAHGLAVHPDGGQVVSGHEGSRIAIWEPLALRPLRTHTLAPGHSFSVWALTFSPDGRYLAVGSGRRVFVLEWPSCQILFSAEEHDLAIFSLAFHPSLPILASAAEAGELLEWDFRAADHLLERAR